MAGVLASAIGVAGAGAAGSMAGMAQSTSSPTVVIVLGDLSTPLLLLSVALMVWGVWRSRSTAARVLVVIGSVVLLANQWQMHWLLLIAGLLVLASAYVVLWHQGRSVSGRPWGTREP